MDGQYESGCASGLVHVRHSSVERQTRPTSPEGEGMRTSVCGVKAMRVVPSYLHCCG
jgi:hypothetical protein